MSSAYAFSSADGMVHLLRRKRRRYVQRRRRQRMLGAAAAFAIALGSAVTIAGFTGTDLAGAAAARASSLLDMFDKRSPGERTAAQLTKTKAKHAALAERSAEAPVDLAEALAPAESPLVPVDIAVPAEPMPFFATPTPAVLLPAPPGGGGLPPGGGGSPPGGGPPETPPGGPPTVTVPAVPEPSTWLTMLLGFAAIGWALRRQQLQPAMAR